MTKHTYTDEQIIESLKHANHLCEGDLSIEKYQALNLQINDRTIIHRYGSWSNALKQSGINYNNAKFSSSYSKAETIELLKKYYRLNGDNLTYTLYKSKGYKPSHTSIRKKFGSWNNALEEAGLPINKTIKLKFTKNELKKFLKEAANGKGTISVKEYKSKYSEPSVDTIIGTFGTWNNALKESNLVEKTKVYSNEEIISILRKFISDTGFKTEHKYRESKLLPSPNTIRKRFGSWKKAIEQTK